MKKLLLLLLSFVLLSVSTPALAASNEEISFRDAFAQIEELCAKYDVALNVLDPQNDQTFLKTDLQEELKRLEKGFVSNQTPVYTKVFVNAPITPMSFLYTRDYTTYAYASNSATTGATIELKCTGTINDSTTTFYKVDGITTRPYGVANGLKSWTQISSSVSFSTNKKTATVEATGTLVTESNILGVPVTYTYDHVIGMVIQAL